MTTPRNTLSNRQTKIAQKHRRTPKFPIDLSAVYGADGKKYGGRRGLKLLRQAEQAVRQSIKRERAEAAAVGQQISFARAEDDGTLISEAEYIRLQVEERVTLALYTERIGWQTFWGGTIPSDINAPRLAAPALGRRKKKAKKVTPAPAPIKTELVEAKTATGARFIERRVARARRTEEVPPQIAAVG